MRFLFLPTMALMWSSATLAAPATKRTEKSPASKISIAPDAKATLEEAAKVYSASKKWYASMTEVNFDSYPPPKSNIRLSYIRPNFIRLESQESQTKIFEMTDGKSFSWYLQDSTFGNHAKREVRVRTPSQILNQSLGAPKGCGQLLAFLLEGKTGIPISPADLAARDLERVQVKLLSSVNWKGQSCRRVSIEELQTPHMISSGEGGRDTLRYEHWFNARGQLVRSILHENGNEVVNCEITTQTFNPTFSNEVFKFTPPAEKKPAKKSPR